MSSCLRAGVQKTALTAISSHAIREPEHRKDQHANAAVHSKYKEKSDSVPSPRDVLGAPENAQQLAEELAIAHRLSASTGHEIKNALEMMINVIYFIEGDTSLTDSAALELGLSAGLHGVCVNGARCV